MPSFIREGPGRAAAVTVATEETVPVAELVYRRLRDAIATGALPPRARLSERAR
jgi:DNA-binding GntR family transcriptional regulator